MSIYNGLAISESLKKRGITPVDFELDDVALACDKFSILEIDQVIACTIASHQSSACKITTDTIVDEINNIYPAAETRITEIAALRNKVQQLHSTYFQATKYTQAAKDSPL